MRHVWLAAFFVLSACAGGAVESITTTSVEITTSVSSTSTSTTSTTVPPVTSTTLDVMLLRAAGWLFVRQMVSDLPVDNLMVTEGAMNNYIDGSEEIIAAIDDIEIGFGWGDCADAVFTMRESLVFAIEGVRVGTLARASGDEDGMEDAGAMLTLALEKLTEAALLGDELCRR